MANRNPTFGNAKGRTLPDSQTGGAPTSASIDAPSDLYKDYSVSGWIAGDTMNPWDASHPDCSPAPDEVPAVTHLGSAGGGHDDPSANAGGSAMFDDTGSIPAGPSGLLGPNKGGHDDPSSRSN